MKTKALLEMLERVEGWPAAEQDALAEFMRDMDEMRPVGTYKATDAELAAIERGLADVRAGRFATPAEIEAAFRKHRPA
jgi:hypothetical protein